MNKIYSKEEIDKLIDKYRFTSKPEFIEELISAFEGFILKYAYFLKYGSYQPYDKDIIGLICMLKRDETSPIVYIKKIFNAWELEDIVNEIKLIFINSINHFTKRKEGPFFSGYLYACFKYEVKEWIKQLSQDIMNTYIPVDIETMDDKHFPDAQEKDMEDIENEYENLCLTSKTTLTQTEKCVLFLHYGKGMSTQEIASQLGVSRQIINKIKINGKSKLLSSGITLEDFQRNT